MSEAAAAYAKAESLVALGRYEDALTALTSALTGEDDSDAHCLRAQCLLGLGRTRPARDAAQQALANDPDSEWGHRLLSIIHLARGKRFEARDEAQEAVRLAPYSVSAHWALARAQINLNMPTAAAKSAEAALKADPSDPLAHVTAALVADARGEVGDAERHYREALRLDPNDAETSLQLADLLRRHGRRAEAADTYLAAGRADPTDARVRHGLATLGIPALGFFGWFVIKLGAISGIRGIIENTPTPAEVAVVLAVLVTAGAGIDLGFRVSGTSNLPEEVRVGLRSDHRNRLLRWLQVAAGLAAALAIWCVIASPADGGGLVAASGFAGFTVAAVLVAHLLWRPRRRFSWRRR